VIHFVVKASERRAIDGFLGDWGRELASEVRVVCYEDLPAIRRVALGTWVFCDHEQPTPEERGAVARIWRKLERTGDRSRLLNDPRRVMRRYELLRNLYERGINDFDVQRLDEARAPRSHPVFVRGENDHHGPRTGLLHDPAALAEAVARLEARGLARQDLLVMGFGAERDARGFYRKYAAFNVGGRIVPAHVLFGTYWMVKRRAPVDEECAAEEWRYIETNPHASLLREIFALAGIDWGRIDYGMVAGRVQVFEINTNPEIVRPGVPDDPHGLRRKRHVSRELVDAIRALDAAAPAGGPAWVWLARPSRLRKWFWRARARWRTPTR
jgi:hypothetical protein